MQNILWPTNHCDCFCLAKVFTFPFSTSEGKAQSAILRAYAEDRQPPCLVPCAGHINTTVQQNEASPQRCLPDIFQKKKKKNPFYDLGVKVGSLNRSKKVEFSQNKSFLQRICVRDVPNLPCSQNENRFCWIQQTLIKIPHYKSKWLIALFWPEQKKNFILWLHSGNWAQDWICCKL